MNFDLDEGIWWCWGVDKSLWCYEVDVFIWVLFVGLPRGENDIIWICQDMNYVGSV